MQKQDVLTTHFLSAQPLKSLEIEIIGTSFAFVILIKLVL